MIESRQYMRREHPKADWVKVLFCDGDEFAGSRCDAPKDGAPALRICPRQWHADDIRRLAIQFGWKRKRVDRYEGRKRVSYYIDLCPECRKDGP